MTEEYHEICSQGFHLWDEILNRDEARCLLCYGVINVKIALKDFVVVWS